jgi:hypothetical protein
MLLFVIGLFVGGFLGMLVTSLCVIAKKSAPSPLLPPDEDLQRYM